MRELYTERGERLEGQPWQSYPRPQLRRERWLNLNGWWDFTSVAGPVLLPLDYDRKIRVPFCPESLLSGVHTHFPEGQPLYYRRRFTLPAEFRRDRVLLHIGAADQTAEVWVNGTPVGHHEGGYEAFTLDITDALRPEENILEISCRDDLREQRYPYGKQTMKRGGMWYTPVSGLWQTVWLEPVPEQYIEALDIVNRGASVTISTRPALEGTVTVHGLGTYPLKNGTVTIVPGEPHLWSPEDPWLYEFTVEAGEDRVDSYFALRSLETKPVDGVPRLCLNGKPYFFHGLLDQGYWSDGLFTPADPACYAEDILAMKRLGFNTLRKHIKVEPEQFYYDCDRLGMVVFQDMVNNGPYDFFRDTALPTVGIQRLDDRRRHRDARQREAFLKGMEATVRQLHNHPGICYWTIFNEGWGQFDSTAAYRRLRALDDTRWIDSTSGWFRCGESDVESLHIYFKALKFKKSEKPLVLSEFGGYSCKIAEHAFNPDRTYGYGKFTERGAFVDALTRLYREQVAPAVEQGLCAAIYTQVSDVEDETNGLLTYDRRVCKVRPEELCPLADLLRLE